MGDLDPLTALCFAPGREFHRNPLKMIVPRACDAIISMMRQGTLTAPGLIQPLVSLDEGPAVWDLVVNEPAEVVKFGIRF